MASNLSVTENFDYVSPTITLGSIVPSVDLRTLAKKTIEERATVETTSDKVTTFLVDTCILVKGASHLYRDQAVTHWQSKKSEANRQGHIHIIEGLICLGVTATGGYCFTYIAAAGANPIVALAIAVGTIATLTAFVFATKEYSKANTAQHQINQWSQHPAQRVVYERTKAYEKGFFYCMDNKLKGTYGSNSSPEYQNILHPPEVTSLYEKSLGESFSEVTRIEKSAREQGMSAKEKAKWVVEGFIEQNPLSFEAMQYAYGDSIPSSLENWSKNFATYKDNVLSIKKHFDAKTTKIKNEAQEKRKEIETQRDTTLTIFQTIKNTSDETARQNYRTEIEKKNISTEEKEKAAKALKETLDRNELIYQTAALPVNFYYDGCKKEVNEWEKKSLKKIDQKRTSGLEPCFQPAIKLFTQAHQNWLSSQHEPPSFEDFSEDQFLFADLTSLPPTTCWETTHSFNVSAPSLEDLRRVPSLYPQLPSASSSNR